MLAKDLFQFKKQLKCLDTMWEWGEGLTITRANKSKGKEQRLAVPHVATLT